MSFARLDNDRFKEAAPDIGEAIFALSRLARKAGIDKHLLELVKIRASQINGCAYCVQYHILEAERLGVPADKINLVVVWREAPYYSPRERAALAWTEALTTLDSGVSDALYAEASAQFSATELMYLTSAVGVINLWNRFGAAFQWTPAERPGRASIASAS